jgi:hypothetical protein
MRVLPHRETCGCAVPEDGLCAQATKATWTTAERNWDQPEAVDWERLTAAVAVACAAPCASCAAAPHQQHWVAVEGFLVLWHQGLRARADAAVLVDCPRGVCAARRAARAQTGVHGAWNPWYPPPRRQRHGLCMTYRRCCVAAFPEPAGYFEAVAWPSFWRHHPPEVLEDVDGVDGTAPLAASAVAVVRHAQARCSHVP